MALAATAKAIISSTSGPIGDDEVDALEESLVRLGSARAVSLERLQARHALLLVSPADVSSDSDRVNHAQNLKYLGTAVQALARATSREADLNEEALALVDAALADAPTRSGSIRVTASNRRPG